MAFLGTYLDFLLFSYDIMISMRVAYFNIGASLLALNDGEGIETNIIVKVNLQVSMLLCIKVTITVRVCKEPDQANFK